MIKHLFIYVCVVAGLLAADSPKTPLVMSRDGVPYAKVFGDFDKPPQQRALATPKGPRGKVGAAVVRYRVDTKGRTRDHRIISSSGDEFAVGAKEAATRSVYLPAEKGGKPVECEIELLYQFGKPGSYP
jgi:TonB family protein